MDFEHGAAPPNAFSLPTRFLLQVAESCEMSDDGRLHLGIDAIVDLMRGFASRCADAYKVQVCKVPARGKISEILCSTEASLFLHQPGQFFLSILPCVLEELGFIELSLEEWTLIEAWISDKCRVRAERKRQQQATFRRSFSINSVSSGGTVSNRSNRTLEGSTTTSSGPDVRETETPVNRPFGIVGNGIDAAVTSSLPAAVRELVAKQAATIGYLENLCESQQAVIAQKNKLLRSTRRVCRKQSARLEERLKDMEDEKHSFTQKYSIFRMTRTADQKAISRGNFFIEGESTGWLTPSGMISLAIRRNMSNVAAADIGLVILADVSRWTVCRAEIKTAACLVASSHLFWSIWRSEIFERMGHDKRFSATILSWRQDCTNRSVWNKEKLCALEMEASYFIQSQSVEFDDVAPSDWQRIKQLADVIPVRDGTGKATVLMTEKLLSSLGAPTWKSFEPGIDNDSSSSSPLTSTSLLQPLPPLPYRSCDQWASGLWLGVAELYYAIDNGNLKQASCYIGIM